MKCWQGCRKAGSLTHCWWECTTVRLHWKTIWRFLMKLNIHWLYDPAFPLLSIYASEMKTYIHSTTCVWIFTAGLFVVTKKFESTEMSLPFCVEKHSLVQLYNRMQISNKKYWTTDAGNNVDESQAHYAKWKKPGSKGHTLDDPTYMTCREGKAIRHWNRSITAGAERGLGCRGTRNALACPCCPKILTMIVVT